MIQFTEQQKNEVEKFGFGSLLSLNIPEMPSKLAYWVVRSFDPKNCKLTGCDDILQVKGEDVQLVLGFPRGSKSIVKKNMLAKCAVLHEWRALFPKNENQITPTEVCKAMLECTQGVLCGQGGALQEDITKDSSGSNMVDNNSVEGKRNMG
ncbi:unnamed protein product [Cuscuta europaea]|uniref:Uncharacterized protein n=1 Tax=Cuscuta europaea TaxID=41803 RepID=A0A9P1E8N1_CUSEU|nr:unnamed protein product [Cuscuta europaea]